MEQSRSEQSGSARDEEYERQHVHSVYEEIAEHFSSTRYKPWPIVERFLLSLPPGSVGLDIGCGNGKYLSVNKNVFIIGSDRSHNLTRIASSHSPSSTIVADTLFLPHPLAKFDFAISIAVIHHLSTPARRIEAIKSILETLRPPLPDGKADSEGKALIYVWALEQKSSRRGWDEGDEQDVMVPWVLKGADRKAIGQVKQEDKTFQRYYHLYRKGELEEDVKSAGGVILDAGYEKDNWWAIITRG
ncbi:S-adenosyl-L-methionine-dependent methyltransferase [Patellaria atrata CBS 101060]|uniref:S-adenosyl-L-methionine-dependent methyltransferase n=1 Tax=Patellaria atrata CBS 101060 TaxID=1346257 RepID=A0A9P4SI46_9PEZI|nr:S-adenosyl-L-methionine-dependent methyltransferase [Patellaria atrata CBS 101060]